MDAFYLLLLLFSIVSIILYILVLFILVVNRHSAPFNGHFFHLFTSLGVADIIHTVHLYCFLLLRYWGWLDFAPLFHHEVLGPIVHKYLMFFSEYITMNQYMGVLCIAVNRYCNLVYSEKNLWSDRVHKLALFVQWSFPVLTAGPWLLQRFVTVSVTENSYTFISVLPVDQKMSQIHVIIVTLGLSNIIAFTSAILYVRMIQFVKQLKQGNDQVTSTADRTQINLAVVGFVLFLLMLATNLAFFCTFVSHSDSLRELFTLIQYVLKVLFSVSNPWLLLFASKKTRDKFRYHFMCPNALVEPVS